MASYPRVPDNARPNLREEAVNLRRTERGAGPASAGAPAPSGVGGDANALRSHLGAAFEIIAGADSPEQLAEYAPIIGSFMQALDELQKQSGPADNEAAPPGPPAPAGGAPSPPAPGNMGSGMQGAGSLRL